MLEISEIFNAAAVLKGVARTTSIIPAPKINPESEIFLKTENLQLTGSFKLRGAYYKISQLSEEEKARGVIACSAGNHAQGVALGAKHNGIKAIICLVPGVYDDAYAKALELQKEHNYTFVHPFDDPKVIAGQGTIGLEILDQMPDVEAIIVPIGGGGLISGVAFAIKLSHLNGVSTIADGIAVKEPGVNTFEMCNKYVDEVVTVTDDEIAAAILALIEQQKLVSEGAGAVSVAAAMFNKVPIKGKKTVCLVSGGNIDVNTLSRVITRGLSKSGRNYTFSIDLADKPGQLSGVCSLVGQHGGNIISVTHERINTSTEINGCTIRLELETRNQDHINEIRDALINGGYKVLN